MKLKLIHIALLFLIGFLIQENPEDSSIELITSENEFVAGDTISLSFSETKNDLKLLVSNSYGNIVLDGKTESGKTTFNLPDVFSNKSGIITWTLFDSKQNLNGQLIVKPKSTANKIETYVGPPTILVGNEDFSMLVSIPLDEFDNPLPKGTLVNIQEQYQNTIKIDSIAVEHLLAYKIIDTKSKTGRILLGSYVGEKSSKEFTVDVLPNAPNNFEISTTRPHDYADGNQLTTFATSILKDAYNNTVSDGTLVLFQIENSEGYLLKTYGSTVNGVATGSIVHPDYATQWNITGFVEDLAQSNTVTLNYKAAVKDFDVKFSDDGAKISVGPFKSFMSQILPEGQIVKIQIESNNQLLLSKTGTTNKQGMVVFEVHPSELQNGTFSLIVTASSIKKEFTNYTYEKN